MYYFVLVYGVSEIVFLFLFTFHVNHVETVAPFLESEKTRVDLIEKKAPSNTVDPS